MSGLLPKTTKCSIFQQIAHEFHVVARDHFRKGEDEGDLRKSVEGLIEKQKKEAIGMAIGLLILAALISNLGDGGVVRIGTPLGDVTLPKIYLVFAGSFAWASIIFQSLNVIQLLTFQVKIRSFSRHPGRFLAAESVIRGGDIGDIISPLRVGHHFRLSAWYRFTLGFFLLAFLLLGAFPVIASVGLFFSSAMNQFGVDYGFFLEDIAAISSVVLLISPILYFIAFFIPVGIEKSHDGLYASKYYRSRNISSLVTQAK